MLRFGGKEGDITVDDCRDRYKGECSAVIRVAGQIFCLALARGQLYADALSGL